MIVIINIIFVITIILFCLLWRLFCSTGNSAVKLLKSNIFHYHLKCTAWVQTTSLVDPVISLERLSQLVPSKLKPRKSNNRKYWYPLRYHCWYLRRYLSQKPRWFPSGVIAVTTFIGNLTSDLDLEIGVTEILRVLVHTYYVNLKVLRCFVLIFKPMCPRCPPTHQGNKDIRLLQLRHKMEEQ